MKANSVTVCVFTNTPPNAGAGNYSPELLPSPERSWYDPIATAASELAYDEGLEGTLFGVCYAKSAEFQQFVQEAGQAPPFVAVAANYPNGAQKVFVKKSVSNIKNLIRAAWLGETGGTGEANPGGSEDGWGSGEGSWLCNLLPPLCQVGFWPWLAVCVFTTYRTAEANSKFGKALWGAGAVFSWQTFFARGGHKQLMNMFK